MNEKWPHFVASGAMEHVSKPLTFFSLPREIRDEIYRILLAPGTITMNVRRSRTLSIQVDIRLTHVSRQMRKEATEIFLQENRFSGLLSRVRDFNTIWRGVTGETIRQLELRLLVNHEDVSDLRTLLPTLVSLRDLRLNFRRRDDIGRMPLGIAHWNNDIDLGRGWRDDSTSDSIPSPTLQHLRIAVDVETPAYWIGYLTERPQMSPQVVFAQVELLKLIRATVLGKDPRAALPPPLLYGRDMFHTGYCQLRRLRFVIPPSFAKVLQVSFSF